VPRAPAHIVSRTPGPIPPNPKWQTANRGVRPHRLGRSGRVAPQHLAQKQQIRNKNVTGGAPAAKTRVPASKHAQAQAQATTYNLQVLQAGLLRPRTKTGEMRDAWAMGLSASHHHGGGDSNRRNKRRTWAVSPHDLSPCRALLFSTSSPCL
jgi:hypothetical protein